MKNYKQYLMIPIWELYNLDSLEEAIFDSESSEYLKNGYNLIERKNIYQALKWSELNIEFNFKSLMTVAPIPNELKFLNDEIYQYLLMFKEFMENDEFSLLTDNRPTIDF
jgi:hypothetical protein